MVGRFTPFLAYHLGFPEAKKTGSSPFIHRILVNSTFLQNFKDQLGHQLGSKISGVFVVKVLYSSYASKKIPFSYLSELPGFFDFSVEK